MNSTTSSNSVKTIKRRAQIGELVISDSGNIYRVDDVRFNASDTRVELYGVSSVINGLPNAFSADEVQTIGKRDQKRIESVKLTAVCLSCELRHPVEYSHQGRYGEGDVFSIVCDVDGLVDYYTSEIVEGLDKLRGLSLAERVADAASIDSDEHAQQSADALVSATGSVSATYTVERRELDGTLTTVSSASAEQPVEHDCFGRIFCGVPRDAARAECPACPESSDDIAHHGSAQPLDDIDAAKAVLADDADESVTRLAADLVLRRKAHWQLDPAFEKTVGLIDDESGKALVIVYLHERDVKLSDFELSDAFERMLQQQQHSDEPAIVDVTDVEPRAIKIAVADLLVGDIVFDIWGHEYRIEKVRRTKHLVVFTRSDKQRESWANDTTITVKRESSDV